MLTRALHALSNCLSLVPSFRLLPVGDFTIALTGPASDSDAVLRAVLERLHDAFCFYFRSLAAVRAQCRDRDEYGVAVGCW